MLVKAKLPEKKFGFYNNRRIYDGEQFKLNKESDFSQIWMEKIEDESPKKRAYNKKEKVEDERFNDETIISVEE